MLRKTGMDEHDAAECLYEFMNEYPVDALCSIPNRNCHRVQNSPEVYPVQRPPADPFGVLTVAPRGILQ